MVRVDLSVIVVNWNVRDLLRSCLQSLQVASQAAPQLEVEIIVIDSASTDGSPEMVRREFPEVRLVASEVNLGYAGGNNLGSKIAQGRYLFWLNPDTVVEAEALARLVDYLERHPAVGAVGPQLLWPDGEVQASCRRLPTPGTLFWESTLLGQWFPENRYIRHYRMFDRPTDQTQAVEWVVGAALFIRREAWAQTGPLDEDFFMYFEEVDWCRRCLQAGWEIHYLPEARVVHYEGKSSEQVVAARAIRFQRSKLYYARKHFGRKWAAGLKLFLWLTFGFQWGEETAKWLIGHHRALRRERMIAYGQVLREL